MTAGGIKKEGLIQNTRGKVVSKRASAHGKRQYRHIEGWVDALMEARRALHVNGFVAINGKTLQGKALYVKTSALRSKIINGGEKAEPAISFGHRLRPAVR